jgi:hypothetical protein
MEVYETENGLVLKSEKRIYHLFSANEIQDNVQSVKIGNTKEAFIFLTKFFANKLKIDRKEWQVDYNFERTIQYRLCLEDEANE